MFELEVNLLIYLNKIDTRNQFLAEKNDLRVTKYRIRSLKIELSSEYDVQTYANLLQYNNYFNGINKFAKEIAKTFDPDCGFDFQRMALQIQINEARTVLRNTIDYLEKKLSSDE